MLEELTEDIGSLDADLVGDNGCDVADTVSDYDRNGMTPELRKALAASRVLIVMIASAMTNTSSPAQNCAYAAKSAKKFRPCLACGVAVITP